MPSFPSEQLAQIREEVFSLLKKGAVIVVDSHSPQTDFYSLFLGKNGQMRQVINLKAPYQWGVWIQWNGMVDWNGGMEWNGIVE